MPDKISEINRVKPMHPMLMPTVPFKQFRGYKEPKMIPKITSAMGSEQYTNIGVNRAVGGCRWYSDRHQKPLFADPKIRLQFPYLQGKVVDVKQDPPKTYGEFSQRCSKNLTI